VSSPDASIKVNYASCRDYVVSILREKGYADFNKFDVEYRLALIFVNESPLHIGTGRAETLGQSVDSTVIRGSYYDTDTGRLYEGPLIPGSSLKGVLRNLAESLAASMGFLESSAIELPGEEASRQALCTADYMPILESWLSRRCSDESIEAINRHIDTCFASPVVGIFGSPWLASHIEIGDAVPVNLQPPTLRTVTRVSIDRLLGSQRPGLLYTMEFVDAGTKWRTIIVIRNINLIGADSGDARVKLLRSLLSYWANYGLSVGGRTSVGHGKLRLLLDEGLVEEIRLAEKGFVVEKHTLHELLAS